MISTGNKANAAAAKNRSAEKRRSAKNISVPCPEINLSVYLVKGQTQ